jgi:hypothetical protein
VWKDLRLFHLLSGVEKKQTNKMCF